MDISAEMNLKEIFARISQDEDVVNTEYDYLWLGNEQITELSADVFGKIRFKEIKIFDQCKKLKKIHYRAMKSSWDSAERIFIWAAHIEHNPNDADYSLLKVINSFRKLSTVELHSSLGVLKENDLGVNLNNIYELVLSISAIEGRPFSRMSGLTSLSLIQGELNHIGKHSLELASNSYGDVLYLTLSKNQLNDTSFEVGSLENIQKVSKKRSVWLDLTENKITYLKEDIFMPFLKEGSLNRINLYNNSLDCEDCRSAWLCKNKHIGVDRIQNEKCIDESYKNGAIQTLSLTDCEKRFKKC